MLFTTFCKESIENFLSSIKRTFTPKDCITQSSRIEIKLTASSFPGGFPRGLPGVFPVAVLRAEPEESEVVQPGITHKISRITHKILGFIVENRVQFLFSLLVSLFTDHVVPILFGC